MPITAIWKCDGCGKESTEEQQPFMWARGQMNVRKTFNKFVECKSQDLVLCPLCWKAVSSGKMLTTIIDTLTVDSIGAPPSKTPVNHRSGLIRKEDVTQQFGGFDPIGPTINKKRKVQR